MSGQVRPLGHGRLPQSDRRSANIIRVMKLRLQLYFSCIFVETLWLQEVVGEDEEELQGRPSSAVPGDYIRYSMPHL
jgi:hypothetical protein